MKTTIAHYRVRPDRLAEHEALIAGVFAEFEHDAPPGLRYRTAKLEDGLSFVHVAQAEDFAGLSASPAFRAFRAGLSDRVDGPLTVSAATMLGVHGEAA